MFVNISRNKLLINSRRSYIRNHTKSQPSSITCCNHCGGAIKPSGEMQTCIMCGREIGHVCSNCSHQREAGPNQRDAGPKVNVL